MLEFALLWTLLPAFLPFAVAPAGGLLTVAERSDYQLTATYDEVMGLCAALTQRSPNVRLTSMGTTVEGRSIPLLVVADPPVDSPEAARTSGKLVVLAFGNIHAGEVCGKEALLMLAREIAEARAPDGLLKELVILLAPIFNADGNERMAPDNRPGQVGPRLMGQRHNAQDLDLNRDWVKLESPEAQAMVRLMRTWDPAVIVDTHTTNGSHHRYTITYAGPCNPAGSTKLIEFVRDWMLPAVSQRLEERTGYRSFFYGNFEGQHTRWETYSDLPRYGIPYLGLRHRIAILSEAYAYAPYRDRVLATLALVRQVFEYAAEHHAVLTAIIKEAEDAAVAAGRNAGENRIAVRSRMVPFDEPVTVAGYEEPDSGGNDSPTKEKDYVVELHDRFEPALTVATPYAYLIPAGLQAVVEKLQQHGIAVDVLREDIELDVEVYRIEALQRGAQPFQGHHIVSAEAVARREAKLIPAGTLVVQTAQPLGNLACYLLEPQSDDGLCAWNFFDDRLAAGGDFPVVRLMSSVPLLHSPRPALAEDRRQGLPITVDLLSGKDAPDFNGTAVSNLTWLADGEHYVQEKNNRLYKVDAASGRCEAFHDPDRLAAALAALPAIGAEAAEKIARRTSFEMDPQQQAMIFSHADDLYYARFDGSQAVRLTSTPQEEELYHFSPDGSFVAFVRDDDLYVVDVATQTERALTTDGGDLVRNGKADWVYFEEVFGRSWQAYWWSPDSRHLALLRFDDTPVERFAVEDHRRDRQRLENTAYPQPGRPNPDLRLGVVQPAGGTPAWVDLDGYTSGAFLVSGAGWKPDSKSVFFYVQDRAQTWLDFNIAPAEGGKPTTLLRDTTQAWVEPPLGPVFLEDGSFISTSERSGWRHLYHYDADGKPAAQLTSGEWEVRQVHATAVAGEWTYFSATRDGHLGEHLYRVPTHGGDVQRLTTGGGHHKASVNPAGTYFTDTYSSLSQPPQVRLCRTGGQALRTLDINPVPDLEDYRHSAYELVTIETPDGTALQGTLLKPPDFDAARTYPVWFMTYGGPSEPTVRDAWPRRWASEQMLAQMGLIVFRCDPRSASGRGARSAWTSYRRLGIGELADVEAVIRWVCRLPYVDATRIGMHGHSYGGFLTSFALTHSTLFAAGVAGSPVTDWRFYDSIYTERYMNTPQENPEGYQITSVVAAASNLHGDLLILHGLMDDNVHFQNTARLVQAFQDAGKPYRVDFFPEARHGLDDELYRRRIVDFIRDTLLRPTRAPESSRAPELASEPPRPGAQPDTRTGPKHQPH